MKKIAFLMILGIIFILGGSLGYTVLPDQPIPIKGPDMPKTSPVNPEILKETGDEICIVGHGADLGNVMDRQKAFVAAFCDALRNIVQMKNGVTTRSGNQRIGNELIPVIDVSSSGRIGSFEIFSSTKTDDLTLLEDKVVIKYTETKNHVIMITIINSVLVSPAIEKINFIRWDNFPYIVGCIEVMDVTFNHDGICEVQLSCKD